jgi:hypothetical protein
MSIDFILFEKKKQDNNKEWTEETIKNFLEEQKFEYNEIFTEDLFFVVKLKIEEKEDVKYRLLEVTPTISFILQDDPSLDEFLEIDVPKKKLSPIKEDV